MQHQWIIRSFHDFQAFDEFVVDNFQLRLEGTLLTVEADKVGDKAELWSAASDLAHRYFAALKKHIPALVNLLTHEEYAAILPPFSQSFDFMGSTTEERILLGDGVRLARNELLASRDSHLRRGYDYLEQAREDETNRLINLYKFVETLESKFGGEAEIIKALNVKTEVKTIKKFANDGQYDERHAPKVPGASVRVSSENKNLATTYADKIMRAYEKSL